VINAVEMRKSYHSPSMPACCTKLNCPTFETLYVRSEIDRLNRATPQVICIVPIGVDRVPTVLETCLDYVSASDDRWTR
jgi:hypothetical protein